MLVLIGIGLAAGFITAISPCVLPVLPIVFAGGATGGRRKPFAIIAGLILSFTAFTLFGVWLLQTLGLPEDLLRNLAIALLFLVAATLLFPKVEEIVQRPFLRLTRRPGGDLGGGLPARREPRARVRAVRRPGAGGDHGRRRDAGRRRPRDRAHRSPTRSARPSRCCSSRSAAAPAMTALRPHAHRIRQVLGVVVGLTALAIAFNVDRHFQTAIPGYTEALQNKVEDSNERAERAPEAAREHASRPRATTSLHDYGPAPELTGLTNWINSKPLTLKQAARQGRPDRLLDVLVHQLPAHAAAREGLVPDVPRHGPRRDRRPHARVRVRARAGQRPQRACAGSGSRTRSRSTTTTATWNAFQNQYWPAKYLIDRQRPPALLPLRRGRVRRRPRRASARSSARTPGCCRSRTSSPTRRRGR